MGLFTSPVTFTVNTVARIFSFRAQLPDTKSVVGEWVETAASLASASKLVVKHDATSKTAVRSLLKYSCNKTIADNLTLKPMTVNFTLICHPEHTAAQQDEVMEMMAQAVAAQGFRDGFSQKLI